MPVSGWDSWSSISDEHIHSHRCIIGGNTHTSTHTHIYIDDIRPLCNAVSWTDDYQPSLTPSESRIPDTVPLVVSHSLVVTPTTIGSSLQSTIVIHCRQPVYTDVVTHTHTTVTAILKLSAPGTIGSVLSSQWFPSEPCCSAITTMAARSSASASVRTRRPFVSH